MSGARRAEACYLRRALERASGAGCARDSSPVSHTKQLRDMLSEGSVPRHEAGLYSNVGGGQDRGGVGCSHGLKRCRGTSDVELETLRICR